MPKIIDSFKPGSWEHEQLRIAAEMLTKKSPNKFRYYVGNAFFDLGHGIGWTTILCDSGSIYGVYQAITPAQQEIIILSTDLDKTTDQILTSTM